MTAPASYLKIANCQMASVWNPRTGTNIGGVPPASYGMSQGTVFGLPNAALLRVQNLPEPGYYADWMSAGVFHLPESCTGHLQMGISFFVDADSLANAQAIEMDTKITDANQITYDGSLQFDYSQSATNAVVEIVGAKGGWVETGIIIPKFAPNVEHSVLIEYEFNSAAKTSSVVSITIDGTLYPMPANLSNIPGSTNAPHPWAANEILPQLQQDVKPIANAAWQWLVTDLFYNVW
jgi:hypothetical protein